MKRVKFTVDCSLSTHGSIKAGTVLDLDDDQAKELIELKACKKSDEPTAQEAAAAKAAEAQAPDAAKAA